MLLMMDSFVTVGRPSASQPESENNFQGLEGHSDMMPAERGEEVWPQRQTIGLIGCVIVTVQNFAVVICE